MHTLKVVILDTSRRGRPADPRRPRPRGRLPPRPRAAVDPEGRRRARLRRPPVLGRRSRLRPPPPPRRAHAARRPGDQRELDALYGELATGILPRDRAPWAMTLVHGLEGGRQAVVVRVHHAIVDGLGALNTFLAASTEEPGVDRRHRPGDHRRGDRRRARLAGAAARRHDPHLAHDPRRAPAGRRRPADGARPARTRTSPSSSRFGRTSLGAVRRRRPAVCASGSLDLATMRAIGKATGTTVNGVLHAVVAGALRAELAERGEDVSVPRIGAFGIASDPSDTDRRLRQPRHPDVRAPAQRPVRPDRPARGHRAQLPCVAVEARREVGPRPHRRSSRRTRRGS